MRKYVIGVLASGLIAAVGLSAVASADVTGLRIGFAVTPSKQDKKKRGGVSVFYESNDAHDGFTVPPGGPGCDPGGTGTVTSACKYFPPSIADTIIFPSDLKFDPGTLPDCSLASIQGKDTAGAKAVCPKSVVGQGSTVIHTLQEVPGTLIGTVTAFNGVPSGGNPVLLVHVQIPDVATKPILQGVIQGNRITLAIPPVTGTVIEHLDVTLNKIVSEKKKSKKTGKVTKSYYVSIRCSKGSWTATSTNTYQGGKTVTGTTTQKCTQKKTKK